MKVITPSIFADSATVTAIFTEANRSESTLPGISKGMDFGLNTLTDKRAVEENYHQLYNNFGIDKTSVALADQIHSSNIKVVNEPGIYRQTDGLVSRKSGISLGIQVADCAAILVADEINEVIGNFHAGWRGAVDNILLKGIREMISIGAEINNLKAYVSPSISINNFEVGEEVACLFPDEFVDRSSYEKPHVDLKAFLKKQLTEAGLSGDHIEISSGCTVHETRFFSYRREREKAGRMLSLINLKKK